MTIHVSESELALDVYAVLAKVQQGFEVVIESEDRPIAIMQPPPAARSIAQVIAAMEASGDSAEVDEDFAQDVRAGIEANNHPWNPPSLD